MSDSSPSPENKSSNTSGKKVIIIISSIVGLLILFILLVILFPETFYDGFLYKYYIKSFIEDGSYNKVDTTTYGLMIAAAIFGIYKVLGKLHIRVDRRAVLVILPWMFIGGTYRALEDAEFFQKPVIYLFRSPMIYFTITVTVVLVLLYSLWVQVYSRKRNWKSGFVLSIAMLVFFDCLYLIYYYSTDKGISYQFTPLYPLLLSLPLGYLLYVDSRRRGYGDMKTNILSSGLYFLGLSVLPIAIWPGIASWKAHFISIRKISPLAWDSFIYVFLIAAAATFLLAGIFMLLKQRKKKLAVFTKPLALLIIFGHFLDATATAVGIEYHGYVEKHVVPHFMIELTGNAFVMFLLKLPLVLLVIFALDIWYAEEFRDNKDLLNLVKMGIIILGLAPGARDALRMAMGV